MGYRSQIAFWVEEPAVGRLLTALNGNQEAFELLFSHADKEKSEEGNIMFTLDYIKWYSHFDSVACIEAFMDDLDSDDQEELYGFHRLGEEFGDHDQRGCSEAWWVAPSQTLSID